MLDLCLTLYRLYTLSTHCLSNQWLNYNLTLNNPQQRANSLNADLAKIHLWASNWLVSFDPTESESMIL